jgi:predicted nucleic acid-binding protein
VKAVFADTFYLLGCPYESIGFPLLRHPCRFTHATVVTTDEVLSEFLTFFAEDAWLRNRAARTVQALLTDPAVLVIPQSRESFLDGLELYQQRSDKEYSLADCISMQTTRRHAITEALTNDHHFEQAGFRALFRG